MKVMGVCACLLVGVVLVAALQAAADDSGDKVAPGEKRELLSLHDTVAVFDGLEYRLCKGLTALCPRECGHSGEFAQFSIKKYLDYQKPGQFGDPKQTTFLVQVSDFDRNPKGDPRTLAAVKGLKKGDHVRLTWRHDYVTKGGVSGPERPLVKLEKVPADKVDELLK